MRVPRRTITLGIILTLATITNLYQHKPSPPAPHIMKPETMRNSKPQHTWTCYDMRTTKSDACTWTPTSEWRTGPQETSAPEKVRKENR